MSRRLHLRAFSGRTELPGAPLSDHGANPMNAAFLSQIPLATLYADPAGYDPERALRQALGMLCGHETARCLLEDLERFQDIGLGGLNPDERREEDEVHEPDRGERSHHPDHHAEGGAPHDACGGAQLRVHRRPTSTRGQPRRPRRRS